MVLYHLLSLWARCVEDAVTSTVLGQDAYGGPTISATSTDKLTLSFNRKTDYLIYKNDIQLLVELTSLGKSAQEPSMMGA